MARNTLSLNRDRQWDRERDQDQWVSIHDGKQESLHCSDRTETWPIVSYCASNIHCPFPGPGNPCPVVNKPLGVSGCPVWGRGAYPPTWSRYPPTGQGTPSPGHDFGQNQWRDNGVPPPFPREKDMGPEAGVPPSVYRHTPVKTLPSLVFRMRVVKKTQQHWDFIFIIVVNIFNTHLLVHNEWIFASGQVDFHLTCPYG